MKQKDVFLLGVFAALLAQAEAGQLSDLQDFRARNGCGSCDPAFEFIVPTEGYNEELVVGQGGIGTLWILKRSSPFTLVTDQTEWQTKVTAKDLIALAGCYNTGGLESAENVEQLGSCQKTHLNFYDNTLTFEVIEDNASMDVFKLLRQLSAPSLANCFSFGYTTCDGQTTGFFDATLRAKYDIENTKTGKKRWTITLTFEIIQPDLPLVLAFNPLELTGL